METNTFKAAQLAHSASAIGAAILGVGIGAQWGATLKSYAVVILTVGAIIHVYGMYVTQMKNITVKTGELAKILWITAWICLISLAAIFFYLLAQQK